jgi:hypothetical protein
MARSKNAILSIYNKFSTEVSYEKVRIFEDAVRQFVKARPREWANVVGFLATKVMTDLGYIGKVAEYLQANFAYLKAYYLSFFIKRKIYDI